MQATGFRIPVGDLDGALAFYCGELGFDVQFEAREYGWASVEADGFEIGLYVPGKGGGTRKPGGTLDFMLAMDPATFDALFEALAGYQARSDMVATADGMTLFDVSDPYANVLTFTRLTPDDSEG